MSVGPHVKSVTATATAKDVMVVQCVCERCRTPYSYDQAISAAVSQTAHTMSQATGDAGALQLGAALALAERRKEVVEKSEVGSQPCPKCGYYQSYMAESAANLHGRALSWLPALVLIAVAGQRGCAAVACSAPAESPGGDTRAMQAALFFAAALVVKYLVQWIYRAWWLAGWKQHRVHTTLKPEVSWKSGQRT